MSLGRIDETLKIVSLDAKDIRWPTSLGGHGSDATVNFIMKIKHSIFFNMKALNQFQKYLI